MTLTSHMPRGARYSIGARIENKFLDLLELGYETYFSGKEEKEARITACIRLTDALKFLVSVAWEGRFIANGNAENMANRLDEIGRMLDGWRISLKNSERKNCAM